MRLTPAVAPTSPNFATIGELAPRLARGSLTAEALLSDCLAQIAAHDQHGARIAAILRLNPDAESDARRLDVERAERGVVRGPLHGVPVVLKDNIDFAGLPTTSGNRAMARAVARQDAEQTRRLRQAGAIVIAKTNLSEFSFEIRSRSSLGGDVLNPFNRSVTAGGSSGGTAAAVAAGFAVAGLGTDTGGSIRTPAAYNGLVGLRPTQGLIDRRGTAPLAPTTDTVGAIARSVSDVANLLAIMANTPRAEHSRPSARIGVLRQAFGQDGEIHLAMRAGLSCLADAGAVIVDPVALPDDMLPLERAHVVDWEFRPAFDAYLLANFAPGTAPRSLGDLIASGDYLSDYEHVLRRRAAVTSLDSPDYRAILAYHQQLRKALLALMTEHRLDALTYPTSAVIPRSLDNPAGGWAPELAACSGWPAITLPVGQSASGIPIGLELMGRAFAELTLLDIAAALEKRLDRRYVPELI